MIITPYPALQAVLADAAQWRGFFYPLCLVQGVPGLPPELALPVLSTNGLWYDEAYAGAAASAHVSTFELRGGQLVFAGDVRVFRGHAAVAAGYDQLAADWQAHEAAYLGAGSLEQLLGPPPAGWPTTPEFDAEYFLSTFRGFHYVREQYRRTGRFQSLNAWLRGWREAPGAFFLPASHPDFGSADAEMQANQAYLLPGLDLATLHPVGLAPASPYFADGNSVLMYYDAAAARLVCVNHY
ncbi:hypothetical protein [Hymenobacter sp. CRA2]|uniref:hypothetical protein n=1 Tax=Hymenobacter sp. CRA2 TaxID=1955620 RepID=UPI00098EF183|nr:hypothetical protein [Hymenobacter sp. CRA2]OON69467.1 hypothetical protein B0919_09335 [Hymenobacter sp. CRA2]